jgi:hypothetical protein
MWLILSVCVWYLWRVYTLSYNPNDFPDPEYAYKIWDRRATNSGYLGGVIVAYALIEAKVTVSWWTALLVWFIATGGLIAIGQPAIIALIVSGRLANAISRVKRGVRGGPALAPLVWGYYLTDEEKRSARSEHSDPSSNH